MFLAPSYVLPAPIGAAKTRQSLGQVDSIMKAAVARGKIPGGVVLIGHNGKVIYRKAFGARSLEPTRDRMTTTTVFDLASLTKCIATTTSVMQLMEQGRVRLNDPVAAYLPEFAQNGKADITVRELLTHYSGLAPDLDLKTDWHGRQDAFERAMQQKPLNPPGARFVYSDINFEVLGFLVERVSSTSLDKYTRKNIFIPLGMQRTRFLPPVTWRPQIAPTQYDEHGRMLRGVVHDPTARRMDGVAGHAGVFSTADDLGKFAEALLSGKGVLKPLTIEKMSTPQQPPNAASLRGLGWDIDSPFSTNRGELFPVGSFGHTGFTGTSLWIDPTTQTYIVMLTNAVHPGGGKSIVSLRSEVATAVAASLRLDARERSQLRLSRITGYNEALMAERRITTRNGDVKTGIDVLEAENFRALGATHDHPLRLGLITNQTAVDSSGSRTADVLAHAPDITLSAIFTPEHGIAGKLDTTDIGDAKDAVTGARIFGVYGETDAKRRPTEQALSGIDALVYDIQDVGVRFYTYESTLGYFLEAAAKNQKPIVVLDRPDPIGGNYVQGPIADEGRSSFVDYWQTPVRHGMTVGELARMFNRERHIDAMLTVIAMGGWMRGDWFDSTGRLWINPSPNMRSLTAATLYPGVGMIETTNVSVGRGTDTPFERVGAPWINPGELARYLNAREISGVRFVPTHFMPESSVYAHQDCGGISLVITDRDALDAVELGIEIVSALHKLYPSAYRLAGLDTLMVSQSSLASVDAGEDPRRIAEQWQDAIDRFQRLRKQYLLY